MDVGERLVERVENPTKLARVVGRLIESDVSAVERFAQSNDFVGTRAKQILEKLYSPLRSRARTLVGPNATPREIGSEKIARILLERENYLQRIKNYRELLEVPNMREQELRREVVKFPCTTDGRYIGGVLQYVEHYAKKHLPK
jgi:hypothetical protein